MNKVRKFFSRLLSIVFIAIGLFLTFLGLGADSTRKTFLDYLGKDYYYTRILAFGILVLIGALVLIINIFTSGGDNGQILVQSDSGNITITKDSLASTIKTAIESLDYADVTSCKIRIDDNNDIFANVDCDIFTETNYQSLGKEIQTRAEEAILNLTGLSKARIDVKLHRAQKAERTGELR